MKKEVIEKIAIMIGVVFIMGVTMVFLILKKEKYEIEKELVIDEIKDIEEEITESEEIEKEKESFEESEEVENLSGLEKDVELKESKESEKFEEKESETVDNTSSKKDTIKDEESKKILFLKMYCQSFSNTNHCTKSYIDIYSFNYNNQKIEKIYELGESNSFLFEPEDRKVYFTLKSGGVTELNLYNNSLRSIIQMNYRSKVTDMLIEDDKFFYLSGSCGETDKSDCILQYMDMSNNFFNKFIASDIKSEELRLDTGGSITLGSYDKSKKSLYFLKSKVRNSKDGSLYKVNINNGDIKLVGKYGDDGYEKSFEKRYVMELDDNYEYCKELDIEVDLDKIAKIHSRGNDEGPYTIYELLGCIEE